MEGKVRLLYKVKLIVAAQNRDHGLTNSPIVSWRLLFKVLMSVNTPCPLKVLAGSHLTADQPTNHVPVVQVKGQQGGYDTPLGGEQALVLEQGSSGHQTHVVVLVMAAQEGMWRAALQACYHRHGPVDLTLSNTGNT